MGRPARRDGLVDPLSDGAVLLAATQDVHVSDREDYVRAAADHIGVPFE